MGSYKIYSRADGFWYLDWDAVSNRYAGSVAFDRPPFGKHGAEPHSYAWKAGYDDHGPGCYTSPSFSYGDFGDKGACEAKCTESADCAFYAHGWDQGRSTWCALYSTCGARDFREAIGNVKPCGSSGADGVRVTRKSGQTAVTCLETNPRPA